MSDELILVQNLIHEIRGKSVMLDFDLARLHHIETKALKQAVGNIQNTRHLHLQNKV